MFSIGSFTLTEDEVAKRKAYLEITPDDERRLTEAHPFLDRHTKVIIDRFYDYLLSHEHTRRMLSAPGLVDRLKGLQSTYFRELTGGAYGLAYFENRFRVGQTHHRIGLSPEWYLGAYVKYLHIASDVLSNAFGRDQERFFRTIVSLTKIIYLDMGLALDAYHFSAQAGIEKANVDLRQMQVVKQQLTDMIIHDLQNPLAGIASALQVLDRKGASFTESERAALREASRRCKDLSVMIMNVLQVSRAEQGRLEAYIEDLELGSIAREAADGFKHLAESEGRTVRVAAPSAVHARSDQTLLRRILDNLLRNALRHTPPGTAVTIRVESGPVRMSVIDEGPGIPPEIQAKLFEPFGAAALRASGLRVDTGLGLASCRASARALGAEISVQSDGKRGTSFTLLLP